MLSPLQLCFSMLRAKSVAWPEPEKSIGRRSTVIKGKTIWEVTGPAQEIFDSGLSDRIKKLLEDHKEDLQSGEKISRAASFHMWMVGREPQIARPTIIVSCKSSAYRQKVIQLLKRNNILKDYPGMTMNSMDKMPAQPMGNSRCKSPHQTQEDLSSHQENVIYLGAGYANACGNPIIIGNIHEATLGGVLLINGTHYGFTSLHPRKNESRSLESLVGDGRELAFDYDSDATSTSMS